MSPSFVGSYVYAIDHKNRIVIPPNFRRGDSPRKPLTRFYVNRGFDGCVAVHTPEGWQRWMERLRRRSLGDPRVRAFRLLFMTDAEEVTVDAQGRITIPPALMEHAGLGKEARLHGDDDRILIWDPARFTAAKAPVADTPGEYERLAGEILKDEP